MLLVLKMCFRLVLRVTSEFSRVSAMFSPIVRILACCLLRIIKMSSSHSASVTKNDAVRSKLERCYWSLFKPHRREAAWVEKCYRKWTKDCQRQGRARWGEDWQWIPYLGVHLQQPSDDDLVPTNHMFLALSGCRVSHASRFTSRSQRG